MSAAHSSGQQRAYSMIGPFTVYHSSSVSKKYHSAWCMVHCVVPLQLFINNKWVDPKKGGKLDVVDPRTGDTIKQIASAGGLLSIQSC
jgi:hypothetical protein